MRHKLANKNRLKDLQRKFQNGGSNASPPLPVLFSFLGGWSVIWEPFVRMTRVMPDV